MSAIIPPGDHNDDYDGGRDDCDDNDGYKEKACKFGKYCISNECLAILCKS